MRIKLNASLRSYPHLGMPLTSFYSRENKREKQVSFFRYLLNECPTLRRILEWKVEETQQCSECQAVKTVQVILDVQCNFQKEEDSEDEENQPPNFAAVSNESHHMNQECISCGKTTSQRKFCDPDFFIVKTHFLDTVQSSTFDPPHSFPGFLRKYVVTGYICCHDTYFWTMMRRGSSWVNMSQIPTDSLEPNAEIVMISFVAENKIPRGCWYLRI